MASPAHNLKLDAEGRAFAGFALERRKAEGTPLRIGISDSSVDRDRDTLAVDGWKLENYRKNPIILWMHDRRALPIGNSAREWVEDGMLWSEPVWTPPDLNPLGAAVGKMVDAKMLHTASVGFNPIRYEINSERGGLDFLEQELLEYSITTVPSNVSTCMVHAKAAGIDVAPLLAWAEQGLDEADPFARKRMGVALSLWKAGQHTVYSLPPVPGAPPAPVVLDPSPAVAQFSVATQKALTNLAATCAAITGGNANTRGK